MPKGPQELRLDTYVAGGSVASIRHSAHVWRQGQRVLERLAAALETVKPELNEKFGPKTGPAASAALEKVARNVRDQAAEMQRASSALTTAADALHDAQTTHHRLGNAPAAPPPDATQKSGESAEAYHLRQRDVTASQHHYATESAQRERDSQAAIQTVDSTYDHAIQVMESIHGQPARPDQGSGGSGGGSVPRGSVPGPSSTTGGPTGSTWHPTTGGHDTPGGTHDPGGTHQDPPTYDDPGAPHGPGRIDPSSPQTTTPGSVPFGPAGGPHLSPAATSPALGTMLSGGIVGGTTAMTNGLTSGLSNAMRSTSIATLTAEEQAALSTSRTGTAAGVAGRGGVVGTSGTSRGTSRGGARGGGAGAGGRGDRGRKKNRRSGTDFFEDADDWIDDDEVSPGVLD
jgi:hypothetical protein